MISLTRLMKKFRLPGIIKFKSRREQLFVFAALGIAVIFLIITFLIDPFLDSQRNVREEIPIRTRQLQKYRQFVAGKGQAQQHLRRIQEASRIGQAQVLPGDTASLAAANLQEILKTLAAKHQINIKSEKVLDTKSLDFFDEIFVQIEFTTMISNLASFLYDIETYPKVLMVPDCSVSVNTYRGPRDVRATVVVSGLMAGVKSTK